MLSVLDDRIDPVMPSWGVGRYQPDVTRRVRGRFTLKAMYVRIPDRAGERRSHTMAKVEIYLYSSCTSCTKAEGLLREIGVDAERRDYFKKRFTRDELVDILARIGKRPGDVVSTRSTPYRSLDLATKDLTDDELIDLMVEHPQLLRRPLIVHGTASTVGFNREAITSLVKGDN